MTLTKKLSVAALLLLALGATTWVAAVAVRSSALAPGAETPAPTHAGLGGESRASGPRDRAQHPRRAAAHDDGMPATGVDTTPLPPPVDLDPADRDLDLHGVVVDDAGDAVPGAAISTVTYPWRAAGVLNHREHDTEVAGPATRSARDGTFSVRLARGLAVALRVTARGFAAVEVPCVLAGERVRVTLRPGVRLVVVVTDTAGAPLAGGEVRVFGNGDRNSVNESVRATGTTDDGGVCRFDALPPWAHIFVDHPGSNGRWTRVQLSESGELRREIRVAPMRTLRGTVTDAASRLPIAGARVGTGLSLHAATTTRADGAYALHGWTGDGVPDVHVRADGYATQGRFVGDATTLDFVLHRGYAVAGRVVADESGAPVAGALVSAIASEFVERAERISDGYATSGADGRFRIDGLRHGMRHALAVLAPEAPRRRQDRRRRPSGAGGPAA